MERNKYSRLEEVGKSRISQHASQRLEEGALEWGQQLIEPGLLRMPEGKGVSRTPEGFLVTKASRKLRGHGYLAWEGPGRQQEREGRHLCLMPLFFS